MKRPQAVFTNSGLYGYIQNVENLRSSIYFIINHESELEFFEDDEMRSSLLDHNWEKICNKLLEGVKIE